MKVRLAILAAIVVAAAASPLSQGHGHGHQGYWNLHPAGGITPRDNVDDDTCSNFPYTDTPDISNYIVGGKEVNPRYKYPFIAKLTTSSGSQFCAGSVIKYTNGDKKILTAAHCVQGSSAASIRVELGTHLRSASTETTRRVFQVSRIRVHPSYSSSTLANDVAILDLSTAVTESSAIQPVCLESAAYTPLQTATVIGWGSLSSGGSFPSGLMEVSKPIQSEATCRNWVGSGFLSASMLCAGLQQGGVDSCQGDSGGPLFVVSGGKVKQAGIVSWGYGCAGAQSPGIYSYVANLRSWIAAQMT